MRWHARAPTAAQSRGLRDWLTAAGSPLQTRRAQLIGLGLQGVRVRRIAGALHLSQGYVRPTERARALGRPPGWTGRLVSGLLAACLCGCDGASTSAPARQGEQYLRLGLELAERGQYPQAIAAYRQAAALTPRVVVVHYNLANAYAACDALPEAIQAYQEALRLDPTYAPACYNLGAVYLRQQQPEAAKPLLLRAVVLDSSHVGAHRALGLLSAGVGDYAAATAAYARATRADSTSSQAWCDLGEVLAKQGRRAEARSALERAARLDATSAPAHEGLGMLCLQENRYDEAVHLLERAVTLDPRRTRAYHHLGQAYLRQGRPEAGKAALATAARLSAQDQKIGLLKDAIARHPTDAYLYYSLGVVYGQRQQYDLARLKYEQALALDSALAPAAHNLANILLRQGETIGAAARFRQAVAADSTYALAYNGLGAIHLLNREYGAALAAFRQARHHAPDNEEVRENLVLASRLAEAAAP